MNKKGEKTLRYEIPSRTKHTKMMLARKPRRVVLLNCTGLEGCKAGCSTSP
jgi:hypothetical protein